jgi:hypothetical protein
MEGKERWDGSGAEATPFLDTQPPPDGESVAVKLWMQFVALFVAISVGAYAGLLAHSREESWLYSALFCVEAFVSVCMAGVVKPHSHRKSLTSFAAYFVCSAVTVIITCNFVLPGSPPG